MNIFSVDFEKSLNKLIETILQEKFSSLSSTLKLSETRLLPDGYLTKKLTLEYLNISLSCLNNYIKQGKIPKHRIGSRVLIKKSDLINSVIRIN
jgi:excisionase family DNA binding protein